MLVGGGALTVAAVAAGPAGLPASNSIESVCSPSYGPARDTSEVYLVGTPLEDTVEVRSDGASPSFGQVVRVARMGGFEADGAGETTVLLVPWGFDARCRPIRWTGSWTWATPGASAFFRGQPRAGADAQATRTLDVYGAVWEGHPHSPWEPAAAAGRERLEAEEMFELYALLPTVSEYRARPYAAVEDLVRWRRSHPGRAAAYPAAQILRSAFAEAENARLRDDPLSYGGTYRLRLIADTDTLASFFVRTADVATGAWSDSVATAGAPPLSPEPAATLALRVVVAAAVEDLDVPSGPRGSCSRPDGLHVATEARRDDGRPTWSAELMTDAVAGCLGSSDALASLRPALDDKTRDDGTIRHEADGTYSFRQTVSSSRGPALLAGERIDRRTTASANLD